PGANGFCERIFVDDAPTGDVDDADARLRLREEVLADETDGLLRLGDVDSDEVGLLHELIEVDELDAHLPRPVFRHYRFVRDQPHAECGRSLRDELADATEADDAEDLVGE